MPRRNEHCSSPPENDLSNPSSYPPPRLIFWETTAGCNLACIHCRRITVADQLLPQDLTTAEAFSLIDQVAAFARPIFVLSGGEPLFRPDIFDIARHAADAGLIVALATNGTLIDADVAQTHQGERRPPRQHQLRRRRRGDPRYLPRRGRLRSGPCRHGAPASGRACRTRSTRPSPATTSTRCRRRCAWRRISAPRRCTCSCSCRSAVASRSPTTSRSPPVEYEGVLNWMYDAEMEGGIELKATCAPHYFRIVRQRQAEERRQGIVRERARQPSPPGTRGRQPAGHHGGGQSAAAMGRPERAAMP